MPRALPDELLEEVLRRLPPQEPAELVRAALFSRRWCRLVSDPGFHRRFREFHRRPPPMLGMLTTIDVDIPTARFIPTTAFCTPRTDFPDMRVLDARHGRVLCAKGSGVLAVWDPITNEVRDLPFPEKRWVGVSWTAAILCSAGACDHLDCYHGPFLVVFVCANEYRNAVFYTYSSDALAWSEPAICAQQPYRVNNMMGSAFVGNALYFGNMMGTTALKYDLELHQASLIRLPPSLSSLSWRSWMESLLTTTEDGGGGLALASEYDSKLYLWSRKDTQELDDSWEIRFSIELKKLFPVDVSSIVYVIGCTDGLNTIFMKVDDDVYTIDLKTCKANKVYEGTIDVATAFPYMSFYTPALKGICTGEGPSVGHSSA